MAVNLFVSAASEVVTMGSCPRDTQSRCGIAYRQN